MTWTPELFIILGSPSLRGSGLKYHSPERESETLQVSLFTREWIEIPPVKSSTFVCKVSLFTREWIEMVQSENGLCRCLLSPSLRGSGLKSCMDTAIPSATAVSLFTREWIEIKATKLSVSQKEVSLFTREWIEMDTKQVGKPCRNTVSLFTREWIEIIKSSACDSSTFSSPSLRGSGLKSPRSWSPNTTMVSVSLFTREWIEMCAECTQDDDGLCLPLYEGVD